ncbi:GATA transcription factor 12-like [Cynara cardunculus var. scolymus]|uniref:GATA transcription factor n=1 Tax=Cynara cardunculus var. scolymus TaxID=59895 RepID=A0A103XZQ0_CYNCS|nr:GATA transcription factor 12-like [Cynara cardunculus var. scolymus]KVH99859.1 Transcription factor, GATA, plant [Cynara cardunculus var. scolymus]
METPPQFFTLDKRHSDVKTEHFIIDDLLNFPTDEILPDDHDDHKIHLLPYNNNNNTTTDSSNLTTGAAAVDSCNSSVCGATDLNFTGEVARRTFTDTQFSHDLGVPYDDMAELEWLSNFVEESFSSEDMEKLQLISGVKPRPDDPSETHQFQHETDNRTTNPIFNTDMTVPGKARTKRSRAAPCNWTSRLLVLSPTSTGPTATMSSESESDIVSTSTGKKTVKAPPKKKEVFENASHNGEGRKCLHCATDKTPQWRTGPLGPKTLCNACGVRYKSGRLVPEYRPAASPTFVLTKHSNSHRKVLELRRQKEMQRAHPQPFFHHQNMMFDVPKGPDDYLIHQHIGPDYRQLI